MINKTLFGAQFSHPFCHHHPALHIKSDSAGVVTTWVECLDCGLTSGYASTPEEALCMWNDVVLDKLYFA